MRVPPVTLHSAPMKLFSPLEIGPVTLRNRIVKSAMVEGRCDGEGRPTPAYAALLGAWAAGGVGLSVTGMAHVIKDTNVTPYELGLFSDDQIAPLHNAVDAVHRQDGKVFVQLCYAPPQVTRATAMKLRSPALQRGFNPVTFTCNHRMSDDDLHTLANAFGAAANRARLAGADGVQLHAAHGYLLSRSVSPLHNRRTDAWGGSHQRRMKLLLTVIEQCQKQAGKGLPIAVKLNAHDGRPGGMTIEDCQRVARDLETAGCVAIEVSAGTAEVGLSFYPNKGGLPMDLGVEFLETSVPLLRLLRPGVRRILKSQAKVVAMLGEAYFVEEAKAIADVVKIPVIAQGGIRSLAVAESILGSTQIAAIAMARPLVCEPDLPNRWQHGQSARARCTSCNRCYVRLGLGNPLDCDTFHKPAEASE
jgi:2,4-dienoyl-CoA reductase-like NADH-dependent reductase (Old Yellow Enzyme family)